MLCFCWTLCLLGIALDNLASEASDVVPLWFAPVVPVTTGGVSGLFVGAPTVEP